VILLAIAGVLAWSEERSRAQDAPATDEPAVTHDEDPLALPVAWDMSVVRFRVAIFDQEGHGYQSQDGPAGGPGSEALMVYQGIAHLALHQNEDVTHTATIPLDVVTSASADALDATTSASRVNEASGIDYVTEWQATDVDGARFRGGFRIEEPFRSFFTGAAYVRSLAQDNALVSVSGNYIHDFFDTIDQNGVIQGNSQRQTLNLNGSVSQVLSPTTIAWLTYGVTRQWGVLQQTWNGVPVVIDCPPAMMGPDPCYRQRPAAEQLPDSRLRHALSARLAQFVPATRSTVRLHYRYYVDDWGMQAHTALVELYQELGAYLRLGLRYRYHFQTGVDFWTRSIPGAAVTDPAPRTSDSDLARLHANEVGAKLLVYFHPRGHRRGDEGLEVGYLRYARRTDDEALGIPPGATDMNIDVWSLSYSRVF